MNNNHINYIELPATDIPTTKKFYTQAFGWSFTDYGETYTAFSNSGVEGGFEKTDSINTGGTLVILHHDDLAKAKDTVMTAGGKITKDIFSFPGGQRFQFTDPNGNELAVWCETSE
ncbi:MAG: VOC family protein [Candidatus Gracilibacteria bacterium]|nr:VOC family protein [Candidatus Gracilibacteria bacterium]